MGPIQFDWCPYTRGDQDKERDILNAHTEEWPRVCTVRKRPATSKQRVLRSNQTRWYLDLEFLPSRTVRRKFSGF